MHISDEFVGSRATDSMTFRADYGGGETATDQAQQGWQRSCVDASFTMNYYFRRVFDFDIKGNKVTGISHVS